MTVYKNNNFQVLRIYYKLKDVSYITYNHTLIKITITLLTKELNKLLSKINEYFLPK